MEYSVLVGGKKLNNIISLAITDRFGGQADDIRVSVLNSEQIDYGQDVTASFGGFKSGIMTVDEIYSGTRTTQFGAISAPLGAKKTHTRHWLKVRLFDIVNDVASNCGVSVFYQGVANIYYENVTQLNETDLAFLNRLCGREGYALKLDDNRLVIYKKELLESRKSVMTIGYDSIVENRIAFAENPNKVNSVTVRFYSDRLIEYTASKKETGEKVVKTEYVADEAEAERFAKAYLRAYSEAETTVEASILLNDKIAAGSCVDFKDFGRFNGKYFINECSYDPDKERARIIGRRIL